jgi:hypothetical protein
MVGGTEAYPSFITKPLPWDEQLLLDEPEAYAAFMMSEAVDMGHQSILEKLQRSPLNKGLVQQLLQQARLAMLWGIPPIRWGAIITCMVGATCLGNSMQLSEDGTHMLLTIKESKRSKLMPLASRKVITLPIPTNTLGGKVLEVWLKVGLPFNNYGVERATQPFLQGPSGEALGESMKMKKKLLPELLEVCKEGGWSQQKLELAKELLPQSQYGIRKLYGSIISKHSTTVEEVKLRTAMMDTSTIMLASKYVEYPISKLGLELLEEWGATMEE